WRLGRERFRGRYATPSLSVSADLYTLDGPRFAGCLVSVNDHAMQLSTVLRRFHPAVQTDEEAPDDHILVHADDRRVRSGHSRIGLIGKPARQDSLVCSRNMRMSADHCGCPAIQVPAHCHLFTGQFGVEIDKSDLD